MRLFLILYLFPITLFSQEKIALYYANNEFLPTAEHIKKIDSLKSVYKPESITITLKGYANEIGNEEANLKLSKKRTEFIAQQFDEYTISSMISKGEMIGDLEQNRRVEIEININKIAKSKKVKSDSLIIETNQNSKINDFEELNIGDKIELKNIFFFPGNDLIKNSSTESLKELVSFLNLNKDVKIRILGHVCCPPGKNLSIDGINTRTGKQNLSKARAKRVHDYLVSKGIKRNRIKYEGLASMFPLKKGDEFDRRVEIEIIK